MATYTYPAMPILANVWWKMHEPPASQLPDEAGRRISLSPLKPEDLFRSTGSLQGPFYATHIIRTATASLATESHVPGNATEAFPCTVWEVPPGSGHYYVTTWAHVVGAGFLNEHSRIYVSRWGDTIAGQPPLFEGYI